MCHSNNHLMHDQSNSWSIQMINSFSSNWFTLLLLCTSAPLVLYCDRFDRGSRQVKRELVDLLMEDYDVSLFQRVGIHNYYTKDHIITCDRCISGKFYSFVRWIIWWQVTSDEDAWRPLIRYRITSICILWFCCDILSCGMSWNIWNWLYYQHFWRELYFKKENAQRILSNCNLYVTRLMRLSCRWQPTNDEKMVSMFYFLNIINLVSFQAGGRLMTSFQ